MSDARIKFRCFQCNRLLGVSSSKAGTTVACPKCSAELIVPAPNQNEGGSGSQASLVEVDPANVFRNLLSNQSETHVSQPQPPPQPEPARQPPPFQGVPTPPTMEVSSTMFTGKEGPRDAEPANPFSFLQTEEPPSLRAEPTHRHPKSSEPATSAPTATPEPNAPVFPTLKPDGPGQPIEPKHHKSAPIPIQPVPPPPKPPKAKITPQTPISVPAPEPPPAPPPQPAFPTIQVEPQPLRDAPPPLAPPVHVDPSPTLTQREPPLRRNDVVLPRTAVILWSFLVLMTLVLAFTTGLLAGHFFWPNQTPAAVQTQKSNQPVSDQP